jgi:hypothetical protein
MESHALIEQHDSRYAKARALLEHRGIQPENGSYTSRQLARELARRGWRWELGVDQARATKAFVPAGTIPQSFVAEGANQPEALAIVLADAIRYDDEHGLSLAGPYRADIVLRAVDEDIVAVVEVKNPVHLTANIAAKFRRDLMADARLGIRIPFFLVISQDVGFLWNQEANPSPAAEPTREFPMHSVVAHYAGRFGRDDRLTGRELEPIVALWLRDLATAHPERPKPADALFADTRFLERIRGASVDFDVLV